MLNLNLLAFILPKIFGRSDGQTEPTNRPKLQRPLSSALLGIYESAFSLANFLDNY